jgi:hypothetical protein
MPYFARLLGPAPRRRPVPARDHLEALEERTMLSGSAASLAASQPIVYTVTDLQTTELGVVSAEVGQKVAFSATVKDASTGEPLTSGKGKPSKGLVEFFTDSADPIILGKVKLNRSGEGTISTNVLKVAGPYQIEAEFLPAGKYFTASTSAPLAVTITPQTLNAPTFTSIQPAPPTIDIPAPTNVIETGEPLALGITVQNSDSSIAGGIVKLTTVSRHPVTLAEAVVNNFGQQVTIATGNLEKVGIYNVQAKYLPSTNRFAESFSAPFTVAVTPLTAASFRVTPVVRHGKLNKPVSFTVTALNPEGKPLTSYTGTVVFSSPTDSWTTFPPSVYASLHISAPPPQSTGLAEFTPQSFIFTPADHGSHTFTGGVIFGKAGAENIKVTQANDSKVFGKATFAIE